MIGKAELERLLVIVNGNWGIEGIVLAVVAAAYLWRLSHVLKFNWHNWLFDLVPGMRVAIAIMAISIGVALTRGTIWIWSVIYVRGDFTPELLGVLLAGATIGAGGFLMAIVQIGVPLFGNMPWIMALCGMTIFTAASLFFG
jgi:hypothetical protein